MTMATKPSKATQPATRRVGERGAAGPATVVVLMPTMLLLLWFAVFTGRMVNMQQEIVAAARDASRQAAVHGTSASAYTAAVANVEASLAGAGITCQNLRTDVDIGNYGAGGMVTVTITCEVSLADVTSVWAPGTKTFTESSTAVIDTYRGGDE